MDGLRSKLAASWNLDDLNSIVTAESPESVWLELKEGLPLADGGAGWRLKRKLHGSERDGLAKEIVALANTYGGTILVGVTESDAAPKRAVSLASPLPDLHDLVDRLRMAISATIDPPIFGLSIEGIPVASGAPDGYLVITVPASQSRPHGHGRPPQVFVRRDDRSEPANMRDMQGMFWEARTSRERVEQELLTSEANFRRFTPRHDLAFQFVAISERPLELYNLPSAVRGGSVFKSIGSFLTWNPADAAEFPASVHSWRPTATGVEAREVTNGGMRDTASLWEVDETGIVSVTGSRILGPGQYSEAKQFYPGWYSKTAGSLLALAEIVASWAKYDGDWIVAGRFEASVSPLQPATGVMFDSAPAIDLTDERVLRPVRIRSGPAPEGLKELADRIWAAFGMIRPLDDKSIHNGASQILQFR